ncbi:hypothetical protein [Magnetospirillum aberrantis]|uniref:hypothetical protein n=1 Tax=Magnetospirillum aberrantis TaxID=1105283 RepID=UPI001F11D67C|nr:hypothetical protein [Magnetospirillum aberrantis]
MLLAAEGDERRQRHDELMAVAWCAAALGRAKKMPPLNDMLSTKPDQGSVDARLKATLKTAFPIRSKSRGQPVDSERRN